jgi:hypothetical protein
MSDPEAIAKIEAELARDCARLEQVQQERAQLLKNIPHLRLGAVAIGISLRVDIHGLSDRIFRNRCRLANVSR